MLNWAAVALMACFGTYYFLNKKSHRQRALACKALATAVPGILLIWHTVTGGVFELSGGGGAGMTVTDISGLTVSENTGLAAAGFWLTLAAIILYMAADVLLECKFVLGAISFAAGHLLMAAGMLVSGESVCVLRENGKWELNGSLTLWACAAFLIFTASAVIALRKYLIHLKKKKLFYPAAAYVTVLSIMAALAVASGIRMGGLSGLIPAAGGVCFVVSDILLGRNRLGKKRSTVIGALVLILYYLAVYLLAVSYLIH